MTTGGQDQGCRSAGETAALASVVASFLHRSLNFPGGFGILTCGIGFGAVYSLTHATLHPSSRHFLWGGGMILCYGLWNASRCFTRLVTGHAPGLAGET